MHRHIYITEVKKQKTYIHPYVISIYRHNTDFLLHIHTYCVYTHKKYPLSGYGNNLHLPTLLGCRLHWLPKEKWSTVPALKWFPVQPDGPFDTGIKERAKWRRRMNRNLSRRQSRALIINPHEGRTGNWWRTHLHSRSLPQRDLNKKHLEERIFTGISEHNLKSGYAETFIWLHTQILHCHTREGHGEARSPATEECPHLTLYPQP